LDNQVLFLIEGDEFSAQIEKEAKKAKFSGTIVKLSNDEAMVQTTTLPLLVKGAESLGPNSLCAYFRSIGEAATK